MSKESDVGAMPPEGVPHSAFPASLPPFEVIARFWTELKKILPANEMHVIDPYVLDDGGADPVTYAEGVASLLRPALRVVERLVVLHGKPNEGIRELLARDIARVNSQTSIEFKRGSNMHARYLVADRSRALRMEFSFNRMVRSFGTAFLVEDAEDLARIVDEVERLHPASEA